VYEGLPEQKLDGVGKSVQQIPLVQSLFAPQLLPLAHLVAHRVPPQSTPVSPLFFFPSKQLTQAPASQIASAQSVLDAQVFAPPVVPAPPVEVVPPLPPRSTQLPPSPDRW